MLNTRINIRNQEEYVHIYLRHYYSQRRTVGRLVGRSLPFFSSNSNSLFYAQIIICKRYKISAGQRRLLVGIIRTLSANKKKAVRHIEILLMVCIYQKRKKPSKINDILIERKNPIKGAGWLHSYGIQLN